YHGSPCGEQLSVTSLPPATRHQRVYLAQLLSYHSLNEEQGTKNISWVTSFSITFHHL
ncbi:MAG: hypothetical protein RLZZ23_2003, partial [Verrucomicrobiota bacterium]